MRTIKKTGDPVKISSGDVFGFEGDSIDYSPENNYGDGPVQMRPELMLEALLLGRGLTKAGTSAAKNILKKGQTKAQRVINELLNESTKQVGENAAINSIAELLGFK